MTTREQLTHERVKALIEMISDDGPRSNPGELPPGEYVATLQCVADVDEAASVAENCRNGDAPNP